VVGKNELAETEPPTLMQEKKLFQRIIAGCCLNWEAALHAYWFEMFFRKTQVWWK